MPRGRSLLTALALSAIAVLAIAYGVTVGSRGRRIIVATTTSLYDTGLLDAVEREFEGLYGGDLCFISVGTGLALEHAERGDADAVLVHAPVLEFGFLARGQGVVRKVIAYNFFAIVGPGDDPAGIGGLSPPEAMGRIARAGRDGAATWVSRGDRSGTHMREVALWTAAGLDPAELVEEPWFVESGTGMGKTLMVADEKGAYTLADMGTYLRYRREGVVSLEALVTRGKGLLNVYSVMAVNPSAHPGVNFEGAVDFIRFLVSEEGQSIIAGYGAGELGEPLFRPAVALLREGTDPELAAWIAEHAFVNGTECPPELRAGCDELYG